MCRSLEEWLKGVITNCHENKGLLSKVILFDQGLLYYPLIFTLLSSPDKKEMKVLQVE